jgi:hypothetical protein
VFRNDTNAHPHMPLETAAKTWRSNRSPTEKLDIPRLTRQHIVRERHCICYSSQHARSPFRPNTHRMYASKCDELQPHVILPR